MSIEFFAQLFFVFVLWICGKSYHKFIFGSHRVFKVILHSAARSTNCTGLKICMWVFLTRKSVQIAISQSSCHCNFLYQALSGFMLLYPIEQRWNLWNNCLLLEYSQWTSDFTHDELLTSNEQASNVLLILFYRFSIEISNS